MSASRIIGIQALRYELSIAVGICPGPGYVHVALYDCSAGQNISKASKLVVSDTHQK